MINSLELTNFGPLPSISWSPLGRINLIIGPNDCGKTYLLRALYSAVRTLEDYKRGQDPREMSEILFEKMYWTFQAARVGEIVSRGTLDPLRLKLGFWNGEGGEFSYEFDHAASRTISEIRCTANRRQSLSVFLPSSEILSAHAVILASRERDRAFGFDEPTIDLARWLRGPQMMRPETAEFAVCRQNLQDLMGGLIEYEDGEWVFKKGSQRFSMGETSEGIKKMATLDVLLGNRTITRGSTIFMDEPENAMHPRALSDLLDIVAALCKSKENRLQFFITTHSYFVLKRLHLIATSQEDAPAVPTLVLSRSEDGATRWEQCKLKDGMPDNPIIDESIRLYEEKINQGDSW